MLNMKLLWYEASCLACIELSPQLLSHIHSVDCSDWGRTAKNCSIKRLRLSVVCAVYTVTKTKINFGLLLPSVWMPFSLYSDMHFIKVTKITCHFQHSHHVIEFLSTERLLFIFPVEHVVKVQYNLLNTYFSALFSFLSLSHPLFHVFNFGDY